MKSVEFTFDATIPITIRGTVDKDGFNLAGLKFPLQHIGEYVWSKYHSEIIDQAIEEAKE